MQTLLIVITLGSLLMTIVFAVILVRLIRFERRREMARIALLREMAEEAVERDGLDHFDEPVAAASNAREHAVPVDVSPIPRLAPVREDNDRDLELTLQPAATSTDLFVRSEPRSAWPRRLAVAGVLAVVIVAGVLALRRPSPAGIPPTATVTNAPASQPAPAMLELLSLKQTQDGRGLTITGLVQNSHDGTALSKVVATAMVFGADGTFLASGRAPLDFAVLQPGAESGFVITVPVDAPVARYRVGFRSEDGHVIGHIDRRSTSTLANGTAAAATPKRGTS